jgi:hypothetical protein
MTPGPIVGSYWASDGKLLAGPLPTADEREHLREQIRGLLSVGIRTVIDLRTPAEPPGIRPLLEKLAAEDQAIAWVGIPILNGDAPSPSLLELTLDIIDASLARERAVYVHCAGGRGRTGTVVACWWIRHGRCEPDAALDMLKTHRACLADCHLPSPETAGQVRIVRGWSRGR